jgi:hypothetical protein
MGGTVPSAGIIRLKSQLLVAVLPHYLALPENPQPKADENPSDFLMRLATEAAGRSDWEAVSRILGAYKMCAFNTNPPTWLSADMASCAAFLNGQKLEQVGSHIAAIVAYHKVLQQSPGRFSPAKQAAERLAELRKDQPEDFDAAVREFLRVPAKE